MISARGFTLVELLVVISIIAILAVIGATIFFGVQSRARDARRRGDIDAIATALEVHYEDASCGATVGTYCPLQDGYFSSGSIPIPPSAAHYCISYPGTPPGSMLPADNPDPATYDDSCVSPFKTLAAGDPTLNDVAWRVCTKLENGDIYCKRSLR